ncbi:hypothetical protein WJX72_002394 [[Myrmecia] bisecta]|uniref:Uncharacterized protein n=1 Tax=[Myrmecia] bisecta TaxID=41462 RepID=A0AAW1Q2R1_9CHLO
MNAAGKAKRAEDDVAEDQPAKRVKTEDGKAAPASTAEAAAADSSVKIGYKKFKNGQEASGYFHHLVNTLTQGQDLNEYEFTVVLDLLKKGHPEPSKKIGSGVRAIQVNQHRTEESVCFFVQRTDGTEEDFSVRKCLATLFPAWGAGLKQKQGSRPSPGGRRGGRGGGGRFGGRGGGGDRGRRGGRGRGGRGRGRRGGR